MLDVIGTITGTAIYTILVMVVVTFSQASNRSKIFILAGAAIWPALILSAAAKGLFQAGAIGVLPGPVLAFAIFFAVLFGSYFLFPAFRNALLNIPLPALIGVNAGRIAGVFFLILLTKGELSAPFATSAGWGDIVIGFLAIPLAIVAARKAINSSVILLWNVLGALDLVIAITLGFLSSPTPLRVFFAEPGTLAMSRLPWAMIPTMLVPIFLLIHAVVATKVRSNQRSAEGLFKIRKERLQTS
jgi:hypothetical protein